MIEPMPVRDESPQEHDSDIFKLLVSLDRFMRTTDEALAAMVSGMLSEIAGHSHALTRQAQKS